MEEEKDKCKKNYGPSSLRGGMFELIKIALTVGVHWYAITHLGNEPAFIFLEGMYIAFIFGGICAEANRQSNIDLDQKEEDGNESVDDGEGQQ